MISALSLSLSLANLSLALAAFVLVCRRPINMRELVANVCTTNVTCLLFFSSFTRSFAHLLTFTTVLSQVSGEWLAQLHKQLSQPYNSWHDSLSHTHTHWLHKSSMHFLSLFREKQTILKLFNPLVQWAADCCLFAYQSALVTLTLEHNNLRTNSTYFTFISLAGQHLDASL